MTSMCLNSSNSDKNVFSLKQEPKHCCLLGPGVGHSVKYDIFKFFPGDIIGVVQPI